MSFRMTNLLYLTMLGLLITASLFLAGYELQSLQDMRHLVLEDVSSILAGVNNTSEINTLNAEINNHLTHKVHTTYSAVGAIFGLGVFLLMMGLFFYRQLRSVQQLSLHETKLEALLYSNQVNELQKHPSNPSVTTNALFKLQQNRELFIAEVTKALHQQDFILHYQPIMDVKKNQIQGVEALVRWQHAEFGLLMPSTFLPLCESTDTILPLGAWIFKQACLQLKQWHSLGYQHLYLSVNLSARQFNDSNLLPLIQATLKETGIPPESLKLEITESIIMQNKSETLHLLKSLRSLGIELSLDDFGTGFASLQYLKQFPFDVIKIDKSFVDDMGTNLTSLAIVESIVSLGKSLGLTVVAEGVEDNSQLYMLKKMQCDLVQGYLYSKPIPVTKLTELLQSSKQPNLKVVRDVSLVNSPAINCDILGVEHKAAAMEIIANAFCTFEPMTQYLGITEQEFMPFAELMVDKAIQDGLSIVLLDGKQVSACTIVEDSAAPLNIAIDIDPRFKIIFSLLESLSADFFQEKQIEQGHLAHLFITAVHKDYFGRGLSRTVNFESIKLARERGFDFMCCEFTHHFNEQGTMKHLKNSKLLIRSCEYRSFIYEKTKPFENLEGSASAYIWELKDGAALRYSLREEEKV